MECESDFATVHSFLVRLPKDFGVPVESIIGSADKVMAEIPPEKLVSLAECKLQELISQKRFAIWWCLIHDLRLSC